MDIFETFVGSFGHSYFYQEVSPEDMHSVENESHREQVAILKADHVPLILVGRLIGIDVCKNTEREYYDSHEYP